MKEETKCYCGHTTPCDCDPETLEEVAEILYPIVNPDNITLTNTQTLLQNVFIRGAKLQQERSYSEEDMLAFSKFCQEDEHECRSVNLSLLKDWVEQFKKK